MVNYNALDIIVDSQGFPASQYYNEEHGEFAVETTDGSVVLRTDVDFRLKRLILDSDGFPLPQLWDPELMEFVPRTKKNSGGGNGNGSVIDVEIENTLNSTSTTSGLSAAKGKEVNDKLEVLKIKTENTFDTVKPTDGNEIIQNKLTGSKVSVNFSPGEYILRPINGVKKITINNPIKIKGENAVVYLEGGVQIEIKSPNVEISGIDFRVRSHGTLVGAESILVIRRSNIKIDKCKFSGTQFYYGVFIEDNELKQCDYVTITDCKFDTLGYGVLKQFGQGCSAHHLVIERCSFTNILRGDAIELNIGHDVGYRINDNYIDGVYDGGIINAGIGIGIAGGTYGGNPLEQTREGFVSNNIIRNTSRCAIHLEACNRYDIKGNKVKNNNSGIGIETFGCTEINIEKNLVENFNMGIWDDVGVYPEGYIVSTNNNFISDNTVISCSKGIELGAVGEGKTQYCLNNKVQKCERGITTYAKAILDISGNLVEDTKIPFDINYEPSYKASLFPNKYRNLKICDNITKYSGIMADNLRSVIAITNYDQLDFSGNNFVLGEFTRKPSVFLEPNVPLYYVKGDKVITIANNTVVSEKVATSDGFVTKEPPGTDAFYFKANAGNDYITVVYPNHPNVKFLLGQTLRIPKIGVEGADLVTVIKDIYIASSEYRIRISDIVATTVTQSTSFDVVKRASFSTLSNTNEIVRELENLNDRVDVIQTSVSSEIVLEVGSGKPFATVTAAINSITDNSATKRYKVKVYPGTYNERIMLKRYVGVEGIAKELVIFEMNRPDTTDNNDVSTQSMVEMHDDGSYIRNITVKGKNFRYMIHSEFSNRSNENTLVDNCYIEHKGNDAIFTWGYPHAVGAGLGKADTSMTFKNSTFIGAENGRGILIHDNTNPTAPSNVYIEGCSIATKGGNVYEGLNLDNYIPNTGNMPWYIHLKNNMIQTGVSVDGAITRSKILGGGNSMSRMYVGDFWVDPSGGYYGLNLTGQTIPRGTAVSFSPEERNFSVTNGTNVSSINRFAGFAIKDIPNGEMGWVVNKGTVPALFDSAANYTSKVYLNNVGRVVSTSGSNAYIGQLIQPSAAVGNVRRVAIVNDIRFALE